MERSNAQTNLSKLPAFCFSVLPSSGEIIRIVAGESGYYVVNYPPDDEPVAEAFPYPHLEAYVNEMNAKMGVTKAQREAMEAGSMFGWEVPAACVDNYDEHGRPIKGLRYTPPAERTELFRQLVSDYQVDDHVWVHAMGTYYAGRVEAVSVTGKRLMVSYVSGANRVHTKWFNEQKLNSCTPVVTGIAFPGVVPRFSDVDAPLGSRRAERYHNAAGRNLVDINTNIGRHLSKRGCSLEGR